MRKEFDGIDGNYECSWMEYDIVNELVMPSEDLTAAIAEMHLYIQLCASA